MMINFHCGPEGLLCWNYTGSGVAEINGLFNDLSCHWLTGFICQRDTGYIGVSSDLEDSEKIQKIMKMLENIKDNLKVESECSFGWINGGRYCYRVSEERLDWDAARDYCWNHGGYLAEFSSWDEETKLETILSFDVSYWIGLYYSKDDEWTWNESLHTISDASYTNWYQSVPDNTGNCVQKRRKKNLEWVDDACKHRVHALCQKEK